MALPGVKVGPLDPEATKDFGQVAAHNNARTLIRLHQQMYPPALRRRLALTRDDPRTKALNMDEVGEYLGGLAHENGDPMIPQGSRIVGAAVRGDELTGRVLTFQYELPSGRVGKWHAPYDEGSLPQSFEEGNELTRVHEMRQKGLVALDSEATHTEVLRRQLAASRQENERLRRQIDTGEQPEGDGELDHAAGNDLQAQAGALEEQDQLRRENAELRDRLAKLETLIGAGGGGMPTGGLEQDIEDRWAQNQAAAGESPEGVEAPPGAAAEDPPVEGYDEINARDVVNRIKDESTSRDEVQRILEYERRHANRATVTGAAEQRLNSAQE